MPLQNGSPGSGYAGIIATDEYIWQDLGTNLITGEWYYGEFYVMRAPDVKNGVNNIGMHVTPILTTANSTKAANDYLTGPAPNYTEFSPVINFHTGSNSIPINPTTWMRINGRFQATPNMREVYIGTFQKSSPPFIPANTTKTKVQPYYFIDNVSLSKVPDAGPNRTVCAGGPGILLGETNTCGLPQGLITTYSWAPANGLSATNVLNPTASPTVTTTYTLYVTIQGLAPYTSTVTVTVPNSPITITPSGPISLCPGGGVTLTATGGGGSTYTWSNNVVGGYNITPNPYSVGVSSTRTFTVTSTINGCTSQATKLVTVNTAPVVNVAPSIITTSSNPICAGTQINLTASGASTYNWGGGVTGGIITVTPTNTPTESYFVTGTDANGCTGSRNVTVFVKPLPIPYSITTNSPLCPGQQATFAISPLQTGVTYAWSPATTNNGGGNYSAFPNATTTYTATATLNGCTRSEPATVTVTPPQALSIQTSIACTANGNELTATGASTYTWTGGSLTTPYIGQTFIPNDQGTYTVTGWTNCASGTATIATDPCCHSYNVNLVNTPNAYTPAVLGNPTSLTTFGAGGTIVFDGTYYVRGSIKIENNTHFILRPGTVFYFEPQVNYYAPICPDFGNFITQRLNYIEIGQGSSLTLQGATLTTTCKSMWGGVRVTDGGSLVSFPVTVGSNTFTPEISDAVCAVRSYRGTNCSNANPSSYELTGTNILRCHSGVIDYNKQNSNDRIVDCIFDANGLKPPFNATSLNPDPRGFAGVALHTSGGQSVGDFSGMVLTGNTFTHYEKAAILGTANYLKINDNIFTDNFSFAISLHPEDGGTGGPRVEIFDNNITLPAFGGAGQEALGIRTYWNTHVWGNTIQGGFTAFQPTLIDPPHTGIATTGYGNRIGLPNQAPNLLINLDRGVRTQNFGADNQVVNNHFINNGQSVFVAAQGIPVTQQVDIRCNTMEATGPIPGGGIVTAIEVDKNTGLSDQGSCLNNILAGNRFLFTPAGLGGVAWESLRNNSINPFNYSHGSNEFNVIAGGVGPIGISGCGASSTCSNQGFVNGNGRVAGTDSLAIVEMMDSLRSQVGNEQDLAYYERQIIAFHTDNGYITTLHDYTNTLPGYNNAAYNTLGLHLMEYYRANDDEPAAQQLKDALLGNSPQNNELFYRTLFFDVQGRLGKQLLGNAAWLAPQDSIDLTAIASSGTAYWYEACLGLRYFYKQTVCSGPGEGTRYQQQANNASLLGDAFPNPASGFVTVPYELPTKVTNATLELRELVTGRIISTYRLAPNNTELKVELGPLSDGLYTYSLFVDGSLTGTKKLVVIK